eukprot:tig00000769_g4040.t1
MQTDAHQPAELVFKSDNVAPICPEVLAAIADANTGWAASYGGDKYSEMLKKKLSSIFETEVEVWLCSTGTAANSLALSGLVPPYGTVFCTEEAHITTDECGAPVLFTGGAKLHHVPHADGKILDLAALEAALDAHDSMAPHWNAPSAVSISQLTENGTAYTVEEVRALGELCRRRGLRLHMDGARFANALASVGCSPADMTWRAGVDVLTLGGTKNGALAAEAVVFFAGGPQGSRLAADFPFRHKRGAQLLSKTRFFAAQFLALLTDDLWLRNARAANAAAARVAAALRRHAPPEPATSSSTPGASGEGHGDPAGAPARPRVAYPVEGNEVFVHMPAALAEALAAGGALFYPWGAPGGGLYRLCTSWATTGAEVERLAALLDAFYRPAAPA